jgi:CheY-like chemotaxis protein
MNSVASTAREVPVDIPPCADAPLSVLVVENHDDTRTLLCTMLESMGYRTDSVSGMHAALKRLSESHWDVLISDIGLADGDGWELMRRVPPGPPLYAVAMSGYGMASDHANSRAVGYRHHLVKPYGIERLPLILQQAAEEIAAARRAAAGTAARDS